MSFTLSGLILFPYCITMGFTRGYEKYDSFGAKTPQKTIVQNREMNKDPQDCNFS